MALIAAGSNAISWNIVNKNLSPGITVKNKLSRKIAVLAKHLVHFPPETLHLQVVLEKLAKKGTYTVSLTMRVPSNILHVEKTSHDLIGAIDNAVAALVREVKSLKAELRGDYRWKRPLYRARLRAEKALIFSEPMEPSAGPQTYADMVSELLKAHYEQLLAHARREVRTAELNGDLPRGAVDARAIVDEIARICLAHPEKKPADLTYELWFYQLIHQELVRRRDEFADEMQRRVKPPVERARPPTDEEEGYDAEQPLDIITRELEPEEDLPEERIPDPAVAPPDAVIARREILDLLQREARHWAAPEREIFELHYLSGFEAGEIAMIRKQPNAEIESLINKIHLRLREFMRRAAR
jgi:ribosome-associated translation inhibitor RaiA/DNA-directed RNA polymerase specialized sigma24 family protein